MSRYISGCCLGPHHLLSPSDGFTLRVKVSARRHERATQLLTGARPGMGKSAIVGPPATRICNLDYPHAFRDTTVSVAKEVSPLRHQVCQAFSLQGQVSYTTLALNSSNTEQTISGNREESRMTSTALDVESKL